MTILSRDAVLMNTCLCEHPFTQIGKLKYHINCKTRLDKAASHVRVCKDRGYVVHKFYNTEALEKATCFAEQALQQRAMVPFREVHNKYTELHLQCAYQSTKNWLSSYWKERDRKIILTRQESRGVKTKWYVSRGTQEVISDVIHESAAKESLAIEDDLLLPNASDDEFHDDEGKSCPPETADKKLFLFANWLAHETSHIRAPDSRVSDFSLESAAQCNSEYLIKLLYYYVKASSGHREYQEHTLEQMLEAASEDSTEHNLLQRIVTLCEGILSSRVTSNHQEAALIRDALFFTGS